MAGLRSVLGSVRSAIVRARGVGHSTAGPDIAPIPFEPGELETELATPGVDLAPPPFEAGELDPNLQRPVGGPVIERVEHWYVGGGGRLTGVLGPGKTSTLTMGNVLGTDLGHMFDNEVTGALYMVFGDTYGWGAALPPAPEVKPEQLPDWRSNAMAVIREPRQLLTDDPFEGARMITDRPGHAKELIPGLHQANDGRGEVTKIPTNGFTVAGRMFLHFMSVSQWWPESGEWQTRYSSIAYSDHEGEDWRVVEPPMWPSSRSRKSEGAQGSNFAQVAFARERDYLYLFGIPAGRFGGVKLARVPADGVSSPLDIGSYSYLSRAGGSEWVADESDAAEIISAPVGELSVMWNDFLGRWIMMYVRPESPAGREAIMVREALDIAGEWSEAIEVCPGGYGSYMHKSLVENRGETVYFTRSHWFGASVTDHYNVYLMAARFTKRT